MLNNGGFVYGEKPDSVKKMDDAKKKELVRKTLADRMKKNAEALRKLSNH